MGPDEGRHTHFLPSDLESLSPVFVLAFEMAGVDID